MCAQQWSEAQRNTWLDSIETTAGTSPILEIRSGAQPANVAAAATGTLLASLTLPSDWMAAASGGSKAKSGSWSDASADATGTAGHYLLKTSGGTRVTQGNITVTGGGGDLTVDSVSITATNVFTITGWTWTAPGA